MTTLDNAGTAGPDTLAASGRFPAGPPAPCARLLLTGAYPVLTWMPFLLAGMAIGRLGPVRSSGPLIAGGPVGALVGYRGSWLAVDVLGLCLLSARRVPWLARAGGSR